MKFARLLFAIALPMMLFAGAAPVRAQGFDHSHAAWNALLGKHVKTFAHGNASAVDYAAFKAEHATLKNYLGTLSAVGEADYGKWSKAQRLAFLINAYNAFTVELILTKYPDLESIKDLGSVFSSPWKKKFFSLLGQERHLDDVEHGMIRARRLRRPAHPCRRGLRLDRLPDAAPRRLHA